MDTQQIQAIQNKVIALQENVIGIVTDIDNSIEQNVCFHIIIGRHHNGFFINLKNNKHLTVKSKCL